jgi:glycosyltransferase involved in cell wall biosynthesis
MNKKVVIAGCTKNSATYIVESLHKLVEMGKLFTTYHIVLYENDSTDNTVEILTKFKKDNICFEFISETNIIERIKYTHLHNRVQILEHCRNTLLAYILKHFVEYDLMIMIDLDNVLERFNPKTILNAFKYGDDWSALTANCIGKYYDIWALRISDKIWRNDIHGKIWPKPLMHDCWSQMVDNVHPRICINEYQQVIPINMPLIQTSSSFGGLGIYKIKDIYACKYNSYNNLYMFCQCEHVLFHTKINGKIFICPSLLVSCPLEHIIQ